MAASRLFQRMSVLVCLIAAAGCASSEPPAEDSSPPAAPTTDQDNDQAGEEEADDSATAEPQAGTEKEVKDPADSQLGLEDAYLGAHGFARVSLKYDAETNSFKGSVENMGRDVMEGTAVTIQLSNGEELSASTGRIDPGSREMIELPAEGNVFDHWNVSKEATAGSTDPSQGADSNEPSGSEDPES